MLPQGLSFQQLHGDKGMSLVFTDVVNRAVVGMIEGGDRRRFALEALQGLAILGQGPGTNLSATNRCSRMSLAL